jgi:hypothetical protein
VTLDKCLHEHLRYFIFWIRYLHTALNDLGGGGRTSLNILFEYSFYMHFGHSPLDSVLGYNFYYNFLLRFLLWFFVYGFLNTAFRYDFICTVSIFFFEKVCLILLSAYGFFWGCGLLDNIFWLYSLFHTALGHVVFCVGFSRIRHFGYICSASFSMRFSLIRFSIQ